MNKAFERERDTQPGSTALHPFTALRRRGQLQGALPLLLPCSPPPSLLYSPISQLPKSYILCCYSVAKLCSTLCDPWTAACQASLSFPEFAQTHDHWFSDAIQPISSSVTTFSSCLQSFPASGSFPVSWLFASAGQSIGALASASVLLMNIQGWFPLGWTCLISLQSKGLSRVFSSITIGKHQFFSAQPSLWSISHIHKWLLKKP